MSHDPNFYKNMMLSTMREVKKQQIDLEKSLMPAKDQFDNYQEKCESYFKDTFMEEAGEVLQLFGKAGRFGWDTPGVKDPRTGIVDMSITPRQSLNKELGDVLAVIRYGIARGIVDGDSIEDFSEKKLDKFLDPESKDNLGRRLAP